MKRSITDYGKVQVLIGKVVRNRDWQVKSRHLALKYLDVGCGLNTHSSFVNLDYHWTPAVDVCWNILTKKYPFDNDHFEGIYTEHCLEHITMQQCENNLREFYRMLKPGGTVRIIVPDGELYLDLYHRKKENEKVEMPYEHGYLSPMHRINGIFRNHGHQFIYDFQTLKILLERNGFRNVVKKSFREGANPDLLIDTESRQIESLYVEAAK